MGIFKLNGIDYMGGGGGGNANEQTLTWAEYCALTEEEKANGTTYYINDINGKGEDKFQPVIYSTEEREIGVWTDGKPLYEKTLYVASGQINSSTFLNMPTQNDIERLVLYKGSVYDINDQRYYALPYERFSSVEGIWILCHVLPDHTLTPVLFTRQSDTYSLSNIFVTIQYTKTTDTPGSGTWTPQGVPATHYSTEEQVVGTWTDGSTIYEKTITGTLGNVSQKTIDLSSEINCNLVIDIKGWIMSTDSSNSYQIWMHDAYVRYYLRGNNSLIIDKNGADNYGWDNPYTFIIRYTKTA